MSNNILHVAQYIIDKCSNVSICKLMKLLYYCQVWNLVWQDEKLFENKIFKKNNSIEIENFDVYCKFFKLKKIENSDVSNITNEQIDNINKVIDYYSVNNVQYLNDLITMEDPYRNTKEGEEIDPSLMIKYYSELKNE